MKRSKCVVKVIVLCVSFCITSSVFPYSQKALDDLACYGRLVGKKPEDRDLSNLPQSKNPKIVGNFSNVNFTKLVYKNHNFTNAMLYNTNFTDALLDNSNFDGAKLDGANFTNAKLFKTKYYEASLKNVNFTGADLTEANFSHADLTNADFTDADLSGANFQAAFNVQNIKLKGADVAGIQARKGALYDLPNVAGREIRSFMITKKWLREKGAINFDLADCPD